jgi:predicted transposase/invertase (TIGR01784 family)
VDLSERNADEIFKKVSHAIERGEAINELDIVFLPICHSENDSVARLLEKGIQLAAKIPMNEKIVALMLTLSNSLVEKDELKRMWKEFVAMTKLKVLEVAEEVGIEKGKQEGKQEGKLEDARNFKQMGIPLDKIAAGTGLTSEQIKAL